ncbi:hypothetical protein OIDMADRAFT_31398 [Oidiodendron maius Zn]|uniref:Fungal N-terminal domain-containing protein n=1 Tax=Oidiodendron maius (strain Zn) TaxID=913774 RepID=A0A0C3GRI1_OIDMZ|nr:hypothetical protein OIDMADRAFT_31398 [Oidiodendron maius Zn]
MSFGYSIGDFIQLTQLAWSVVQNTRKAVGAHAGLSREVTSLHIVLSRLSVEVQNPASLLSQTHDGRRDELLLLTRNCARVLRVLAQILEKYNALDDEKRKVTRLWQRVRFGNGEMQDLGEIRVKIATYTSALTLFLNLITIGSQGRVERYMERQGGELSEMRQSLNWITAELQVRSGPSGEGSILTSYAEDDKKVWKEFRRGLIKEGFSSKVIEKHGKTIREYIMELGTRGALDDVLPDEDEAISFSGNTSLSVQEDNSLDESDEKSGGKENGSIEVDEELGENALEEEKEMEDEGKQVVFGKEELEEEEASEEEEVSEKEEAEDEELEQVILGEIASEDDGEMVVETIHKEEILTDEFPRDPTSDSFEYWKKTKKARSIATDIDDIDDIKDETQPVNRSPTEDLGGIIGKLNRFEPEMSLDLPVRHFPNWLAWFYRSMFILSRQSTEEDDPLSNLIRLGCGPCELSENTEMEEFDVYGWSPIAVCATQFKFTAICNWIVHTARRYDQTKMSKHDIRAATSLCSSAENLRHLLFRVTIYDWRALWSAALSIEPEFYSERKQLDEFLFRTSNLRRDFKAFIADGQAVMLSLKFCRLNDRATSAEELERIKIFSGEQQTVEELGKHAAFDFVSGLFDVGPHSPHLNFARNAPLKYLVPRIQEAILFFKQNCEQFVLEQEELKGAIRPVVESISIKKPVELAGQSWSSSHDTVQSCLRFAKKNLYRSNRRLRAWVQRNTYPRDRSTINPFANELSDELGFRQLLEQCDEDQAQVFIISKVWRRSEWKN